MDAEGDRPGSLNDTTCHRRRASSASAAHTASPPPCRAATAVTSATCSSTARALSPVSSTMRVVLTGHGAMEGLVALTMATMTSSSSSHRPTATPPLTVSRAAAAAARTEGKDRRRHVLCAGIACRR